MEFVGIEAERLYLVWVSSAEGPRFAKEITEFTERIRSLGPFQWSDHSGFNIEPLFPAFERERENVR
jgi:F420-non-reducing hydrogenase iron-sulfur subunit